MNNAVKCTKPGGREICILSIALYQSQEIQPFQDALDYWVKVQSPLPQMSPLLGLYFLGGGH